MIGSCDACGDPDTPCPKHCEDCGILWQPGFIRVSREYSDKPAELWALFCPTCWEHVYVT